MYFSTMSRIIVRHLPEHAAPSPSRFPSLLAAAAIGGGLALLTHALWRLSRPARWDPARPLPRRPSTGAIAAAREALDTDQRLTSESLRLIPGARGAIELHGWVAQRADRARAVRLVRDAIAPASLVDALRVRGEDDAPPAGADDTPDLASA